MHRILSSRMLAEKLCFATTISFFWFGGKSHSHCLFPSLHSSKTLQHVLSVRSFDTGPEGWVPQGMRHTDPRQGDTSMSVAKTGSGYRTGRVSGGESHPPHRKIQVHWLAEQETSDLVKKNSRGMDLSQILPFWGFYRPSAQSIIQGPQMELTTLQSLPFKYNVQ